MERSLPMMWVLIPWLVGNRFAATGRVPESLGAALPTALLVGIGFYAIWAYLPRLRRHRTLRFGQGIGAVLLLLGFGIAVHWQQAINPLASDTHVPAGWHCLRLHAAPTHTSNGRWRVPATVQSKRHHAGTVRDAWLLRGKDSASLAPGQRLIAWMAPKPASPPDGPWDFDAPAWLQGMGLSAEGRLQTSYWLAMPPKHTLRSRLAAQRQLAVQAFQRTMPQAHQAAMLEAMALGFRENLAADTRASFSASGTMHVLAVSGLHVGVLAGWLSALLAFLGRRLPITWWPTWQRYQGILCIPLVVAYALFAGASPSVLRASLLFSLWALGRAQRNPPSPWNAWAACLFILSCCQPNLLASVGACLSFSAVAGILGLYRPLRSRIPWSGRFGAFWADLVAMSVAAQAGSLPVAWMTFGQVPIWFLLGNALALPAASLLLPAAGLLLILSPFPGAASFCALPIAWCIDMWLWATAQLAEFPQARVPPLPTWSAYALLLGLGWWIWSHAEQEKVIWERKPIQNKRVSVTLVLVALSLGYAFWQHAQRQKKPVVLLQTMRGVSQIFVSWRGHALGLDQSPAYHWALLEPPLPHALQWFGVWGPVPQVGQGDAFPLVPVLPAKNGVEEGIIKSGAWCILPYHGSTDQSGPAHQDGIWYVVRGSPPLANTNGIHAQYAQTESLPAGVVLAPKIKRSDCERWQRWCETRSTPCHALPWSGTWAWEPPNEQAVGWHRMLNR